jgi:hypothetical protein
MQSKTRYYLGVIIFILGFLSPLAIPLVLKTNLSAGIKTAISGALAVGGPEILMIIAGIIMGKENLAMVKAKVFSFIKPLAPPMFVSKPRFYFGITLFTLCLLESVVHVHWDGIVNWYADFALAYMIFWNVLFLLSLYILGGDFFNRLIGLFLFRPNSKI